MFIVELLSVITPKIARLIMMKVSIDIGDDNEVDVLVCYLEKTCDFNAKISIICIGTDKVIPDCLGPIVGTMLTDMNLSERIKVIGSLEEPVHALNIAEKTQSETEEDSFIIAVDATRGIKQGHIQIMNKPIYPGRGVHKNLSYIGDVSIVGTTWENNEGTNIHQHKIRLGQVYAMAKVIAAVIKTAVQNNENSNI